MANEVIGSIYEGVIKDRHVAATAALARSKLAQRALGSRAIDLLDARIWDALHTLLPSAAAADDLGLITGTFGTAPPTIETGDLKNAGSTTRRCRFLVALPDDYEAAETVTLRAAAGMKTTVASAAATIDFEAYRLDDAGGLGGSPTDLVTTAATTINTLGPSSKDFVVTASDLQAGSVLDVRVSVLVNDSGTGTAVIGQIAGLWLLADLR